MFGFNTEQIQLNDATGGSGQAAKIPLFLHQTASELVCQLCNPEAAAALFTLTYALNGLEQDFVVV